MLGRLARVAGLGAALAAVSIGTVGCGGADASSPEEVAARLSENDTALREAVDAWRASGDPPAAPAPQDAIDPARYLQAQVRFLARHPNLTAEVLPLLSGNLRAEIRRLVAASRTLIRLSAVLLHATSEAARSSAAFNLVRTDSQISSP